MAWGIDNNLTRQVALHDATWLAAVKGLVAGSGEPGDRIPCSARFCHRC